MYFLIILIIIKFYNRYNIITNEIYKGPANEHIFCGSKRLYIYIYIYIYIYTYRVGHFNSSTQITPKV